MNWNELDVYKKHYNEIERFKKFVKNDSTATFLSMAYDELWDEWAQIDSIKWLTAHINKLRERYLINAIK
jgi:hypothetical protein